MYRITSMFGAKESVRNFHSHSGIDFALPLNEPIRTIKDGVIEKITHYKGNIGNGVLVRWNDGKISIYGHMNKVNESLHVGDKVEAGHLLGFAGSSGHSSGIHLHFGLKEGGRFIDPSPYINDIQSMNVKQYVQQAPEVTQLKMNFMEYMQSHMNAVNDSLSQLNLHFITFLSQVKLHFISALPDNALFFQVFEQISQFTTAHASTLYDIIARIL